MIPKKILLLVALLSIGLLLAGCQSTLVVRNTTVDKLITPFKDYAGIHGYSITYANDQTGSYNVEMGSVYVPEKSTTTKSQTGFSSPPSRQGDQPLTSYEETTWNTVSTPGHYEVSTASVSLLQQGSDVQLIINTNDVGGGSMGDLQNYLQSLGFTVETK